MGRAKPSVQTTPACPTNAVRCVSQDLRAEECTAADDLACDHEHALARVVQRLGVLRRGRDMRLHHLEDEEVVFVDERVVIEPAFEARVAFPDQRRSRPDELRQP